nr:splicing factor [Tanacetum cinerariifolium]
MVAFTNLYHDGTFVENPLQYVYGSFRVVKDVNIEGMTFDDFFPIIRPLVLDKPVTTYYVAPDIQLELGLKELKTDTDMTDL